VGAFGSACASAAATPTLEPTVSDLSIVVVAYGALDYLERCLGGIHGAAAEIIVVDNASGELSSVPLRPSWPSVRFIESGGNRGFGSAANLGLRASSSELVLLLNGDAWPAEGGLEALLASARDHPLGAIFGPRLVAPEGAPQRSVFAIPEGALSLGLWAAAPHTVSGMYGMVQRLREHAWRGRPPDAGAVEISRQDEYVQGAVLLLRRAALEAIDGFDESFFMFSEEADVCRRVRRAGWTVYHVPAATFVHVGGASTALEPHRMYRALLVSHLRLLEKESGTAAAERARRMLVAALTVRSLVPRRRGRSRGTAAWLRATPLAELLRQDA
jgi:N-acetylglucosaminyl-diphospho-decaprenol L-rhamnosyltransferase